MLAQSITGCAWATILLRDVVAGGTLVVIVINAVVQGLIRFVHRIEGIDRHWQLS